MIHGPFLRKMEEPQNKRIVFTGKQQVRLESGAVAEPGPGEVRIRTHTSLMSTGTENIVFNRNFDAGTHWDHWVKYPFYPGYALSGTVESIGEGIPDFIPGDRVVARCQHQSHPIIKVDQCLPLPDGIDMSIAPWFALAKIAFHGAMAASYRMGDCAVIIGAGPIGQMSLRWARAAGAASVIVVDPAPERESFALKGGASVFIASTAGAAQAQILELNRGAAPDVVVDTTGHSAVFADSLRLVRPGGRVVLLGDTGSPGSQSLTSDFIGKGVTLVGAHDTHLIPGWDPARMTRFFFQLLLDGRFQLDSLNTHHFSPDDCAAAYETANRLRQQTMGIVFDWIGTARQVRKRALPARI